MKTIKDIKTAKDLVKFYETKNDWKIEEIKEFITKKEELYLENEKNQELIEEHENQYKGYEFSGWSIQTRNSDSWGGFDNELEKFFNCDIDALAFSKEYYFCEVLDDEQVLFNYDLLKKYLDENGYKLQNNAFDYKIVKK